MSRPKARIYRRRDKNGKPKGPWYGWFYPRPGRRAKYVSLGVHDQRAAVARLAAIERSYAFAEADPPANQGQARDVVGLPAYGLREALLDYLDLGLVGRPDGTRESYETKARHLLRLLGNMDIGSITTVEVSAEYVAARLAEGAASETVRKELSVLSQALKHAKSNGRWRGTVKDVIFKLKSDYRPRSRHLSQAELADLLTVLPPKRQIWVMVAVLVGARLSVMDTLAWEHVNLDAGLLTVPGTKTDAAHRVIPISPQLAKLLRAQPHRTGPLLERWSNCRRDLKAACKRAGIPPVTSNDLRRTFISFMKNAGIDSLVVARLAGTSQKMIEKVYAQLSDETMRAAVSSLPDIAVTTRSDSAVVRGSRAPSVPASTSAATSRNRTKKPAQRSVERVSAVPRDGIEPPTRGFSVPVSRAKPSGAP